jgi:hypothetical protein
VWALGGRAGNTALAAGVKALNFDRINAPAAADPSPARLTEPAAMARFAAATPPLSDEEVDGV